MSVVIIIDYLTWCDDIPPFFLNLSSPPIPDHCDRTRPISIESYKNMNLGVYKKR